MLLIDNDEKNTKYTWYGFETDLENRRFKHIQKAKDKKLISEKMALKFIEFFSDNYTGNFTCTK